MLKWQHRFFVLRIFGQGFIRTTMRSTTVIAGMAALVFQFWKGSGGTSFLLVESRGSPLIEGGSRFHQIKSSNQWWRFKWWRAPKIRFGSRNSWGVFRSGSCCSFFSAKENAPGSLILGFGKQWTNPCTRRNCAASIGEQSPSQSPSAQVGFHRYFGSERLSLFLPEWPRSWKVACFVSKYRMSAPPFGGSS